MASYRSCDLCSDGATKKAAIMFANHVYNVDLCASCDGQMSTFVSRLGSLGHAHKVNRDPRRSISQPEKDYVWFRDKGICGLCDLPADPAEWHADHVFPWAKGGPTSIENSQVSHPDCNREKRDMAGEDPEFPNSKVPGILDPNGKVPIEVAILAAVGPGPVSVGKTRTIVCAICGEDHVYTRRRGRTPKVCAKDACRKQATRDYMKARYRAQKEAEAS